jgi:hypothetical protein
MIALNEGPLLSLTEAARTIPPIDGKRPHPSTVFRWMTDGIRGGIRLEHARIGRRICTTEAAIERFMNALAEAPTPEPTPQAPIIARGRTEKQRALDVEAAKRELRARGLSV